ncbi:MAG: DUF1559 domain-containing protein [Gemmataceae bacterium]|nr:DUF1559 domain-containing protein [Gemmataceae bacterium]
MTLHRPKHLAGLVLVAAALAAALTLLPAQAQEKGNSLEGKWRVKSVIGSGKPGGEEVQALTFEFKGERIIISVAGRNQEGTFKTDATKNPKQFDMTFQKGREQSLGIYRIEKDTLTLCFTEPRNNERPTKFESPAGSRTVLMVLERGESKLDPAVIKKLGEKIELAGQRDFSQLNLKEIGLAFHSYHNQFKKFPAAAIYSKDGKPLLSWRVAILPHLKQGELYGQFKLDEPWDSPHNKKLLEKMPEVYAPVRGKTKEPHSTYYQVFTGPGTLFEGARALKFSQIGDGASNTILVVEAGEAVPWTKPADIRYYPKQDLPKLGGLFADGFNALFADVSVRWLGRGFDPPTLRLAITYNDGQPIDWKKLER